MSGLNKIPFLLLPILVFTPGCKRSKTVITINPDGSGTVVLHIDFDRATDEQRKKFREQLASEEFSCHFEEDRFRPLFPEPHFKIAEYKFDTKKLTVHAEIGFTDINRLLVEKNADVLDLKGLDFSTDNSKLTFTVKTGSDTGIEAMIRKGNETLPVIREIVIINARTKESVRFYEEKGPDAPPADWNGSLAMEGHKIERTVIKHNFAGYPVIRLDGEIRNADWRLHRTARSDFSNLDVTVEVPMPRTEDMTYVAWSEPVLLSGRYVPEQQTELTANCHNTSRKFINNFQPKPKGNHFILPLELNFPALPASSITNSVVRLKALRAAGAKQYKLGRIEPETEYNAGGITFKSKEAKDNKLGFSMKGEVDRVKDFIFRTKRGSRFTLEQTSSSSRLNRGSVDLRTFMPLDKGDLYVEFYEQIEYVWLDIAVPAIGFENPVRDVAGASLREPIAEELDDKIDGLDEKVNFDADFADRVLRDESLDLNLRAKALDAVFKRRDFPDLSFVRQFIECPKMRRTAVQALLNFVNSAGRDDAVGNMLRRFEPLLPILQDLAEFPNSHQKDAAKILDKVGNPPDRSYEQDLDDLTPKQPYALPLVIIFSGVVLAAAAACLIWSRRR